MKNKRGNDHMRDVPDFVRRAGTTVHSLAEACIDNEKIRQRMAGIFSFVAVSAILVIMWPIRGTAMWICTIFLCLSAMAGIIFLTKCAFLDIMITLSEMTEDFRGDSEKIHGTKRKECGTQGAVNGQAGGLGAGPKAEVSIRYFIELEKTRTSCRAVYVGRN